jgi:hypothetical protein
MKNTGKAQEVKVKTPKVRRERLPGAAKPSGSPACKIPARYINLSRVFFKEDHTGQMKCFSLPPAGSARRIKSSDNLWGKMRYRG